MTAWRYSILFLIGLFTTTSCAATTKSTPNSDTSAIVARITSHCTDLDAPELGAGKLCIDNGFRVSTDDFAFANWGRSTQADANVTIQTLVDLFGRSNVCTPGNETQCILRPATIQKLEEWNTALSGGRCEGLAALSARMFMQLDHPSMFREGAATVADLQRGDGVLDSSIVYWWATQFLPEVADRAGASRQRTPLDLVDDLIIGLANSVGYTVGIYDGNSGHSVTPFAVTQRDNTFVIHIYDNNFPGERREIFVDGTTNTWLYPGASTRIDGTRVDWSGTTGTLELTPMSARKGPFRCPFCTTATNSVPTVITLASRDTSSAGYLLITSRKGNIDATPNGIVNTIEGATYAVSKGAISGLVTVTLPPDLGDFDIHVRRNSDVVPAGDVVIGLQRQGSGLIQVSGDVAQASLSSTAPSLIAVRQVATTIRAPQQHSARVSVAAGSLMSRRTLPAGETFTVSQITDNTIEVSVKGSNGYEYGVVPLTFDENDPTREVTVEVTAEGNLSTTDIRLAPVPISVSTSINFTPGATTQSSVAPMPSIPSLSTIPSIEISDPD